MANPEVRALQDVSTADFDQAGVVFYSGDAYYQTTGTRLGHGGMGNVYALVRHPAAGGVPENVVGKTFRSEYLYQLRTDEVARRDYERSLGIMERIATIGHPAILPLLVSAQIADNHLLVTPRKAGTLLEGVASGNLSPRRRVDLLAEALEGLAALHEARCIHRDFTLRNILIDDVAARAYLFDFDLALHLDEVSGVTYRQHYQGRIYGSPGASVAPETLDSGLMECAITLRIDVFAIGAALFSLFTDRSPYGANDDMWGLLLRISEGIVFHGESRIEYVDAVPDELRPIIERCLERDPAHRFGSIREVLLALEPVRAMLPDDQGRRAYHSTIRQNPLDRDGRLAGIVAGRVDPSVSAEEIDLVDHALDRFGYQLEASLGRVKGHTIFVARPNPVLLAAGQFPDANTYPKVVTAIDLDKQDNPRELVDRWLGHFFPILRQLRQGILPALFRVVEEPQSRRLFLFSEVVDDPRFGSDLKKADLTVPEALGLGYLAGSQVGRLHEAGLAHNNIRPGSLLLKGIRDTHLVHPAMLGLVEPSIDPAAMLADVRGLAGLVLSWLRQNRIESYEPRVRARLDELRGRLAAAAFHEADRPVGIDWFIHVLADGLAAIDGNFDVLRRSGGDLESYILLLVSLPLFGRLWDSPRQS